MKIRTKIVHEVDERDFNEAVSEFYDGIPYSACLAVEGDNGDSHSVTADGGELDGYDASKLKRWRETGREGYSPEPRVVLPEMIRAGVVPAGQYLIDISW